MNKPEVQFRIATANSAGAIATVDLMGPSEQLLDALVRIVGRRRPVFSSGSLHIVEFVDRDEGLIDTGMVATVRADHRLLMVHGGPRVVHRIRRALQDAGATSMTADTDPLPCWPEADSPDEALMLRSISRTASRDGVELLLDQPRLWAEFRARQASIDEPHLRRMRERAAVLNRLIVPPIVCAIGPPNVGKSTLTNALVGRSASITSDRQGTTRDYVGCLIDLAGMTVVWLDTPGRRSSDDPIEQESIRVSDRLIDSADLIIEATSPDVDYSGWTVIPRPNTPRLRILLKCDLESARPGGQLDCPADSGSDVRVSAHSGFGLEQLVQRIRDHLLPGEAMMDGEPWLFDERLLAIGQGTPDPS